MYIDTPLEDAIVYDKERDRTVGEQFVRDTMGKISMTWDELEQDYESMGIWKMFHLKPVKNKATNKIKTHKVCKIFTNKTMLYLNSQSDNL